jgi:hypothetical protein
MSNSDEGAPPEVLSLYQAIGFIVIQWGQAEQSLDLLVAAIYRGHGGRPFAKKRQIPRALTDKLKFIRKCFRNIDALAPYRSEGNALLSELQRLSPIRNDLIHGAITKLESVNDGFEFAKLDIEGEIHVLRDFRFESSTFPDLAKDLVCLGNRAALLANKISEF